MTINLNFLKHCGPVPGADYAHLPSAAPVFNDSVSVISHCWGSVYHRNRQMLHLSIFLKSRMSNLYPHIPTALKGVWQSMPPTMTLKALLHADTSSELSEKMRLHTVIEQQSFKSIDEDGRLLLIMQWQRWLRPSSPFFEPGLVWFLVPVSHSLEPWAVWGSQ